MAGRHGKSGSRSSSGSRSKSSAGSGRGSGGKRSSPSRARSAPTGAAAYAREAVAEWGKAVRYAAGALRKTDGPSLKDRLNPGRTAKGGRLGAGADRLLSKMGPPGSLAARFIMFPATPINSRTQCSWARGKAITANATSKSI